MNELPKSSGLAVSFELGIAEVTMLGQKESGDLYILREFDDRVLIAVVDGIGHGNEAAAASRRVAAYLLAHPAEPLIPLVTACHEHLHDTRGVVMSIASVNLQYGTVSWLGVGNVDGTLLRRNPATVPQQEHIIMRGGVIGQTLPTLQASSHPLTQGDLLIFSTDGVREGYTGDVVMDDTAQNIADNICRLHAKGDDDALVLVGRYRGTSA